MKRLTITLLTLLLSLQSLGQGLTFCICIGPEGQVDIESVLDGKCYDASRPNDQHGDTMLFSTSLPADAEGDGCIDIIVSCAKERSLSVTKNVAPFSLAMLPELVAASPRIQSIATKFHNCPPQWSGANSTLSHLRTVSLLV